MHTKSKADIREGRKQKQIDTVQHELKEYSTDLASHSYNTVRLMMDS